jgi:hypothetical protein
MSQAHSSFLRTRGEGVVRDSHVLSSAGSVLLGGDGKDASVGARVDCDFPARRRAGIAVDFLEKVRRQKVRVRA